MKSSTRIVLIFSHAAAVALGMWILYRPGEAAGNEVTTHSGKLNPADASGGPLPGLARNSKRDATSWGPKSAPHLAAWRALAAERLPRPERLRVSAELLEQWIADDWQGALDQVMRETPDDSDLLGSFHTVFSEEPEKVWAVIEARRYGLLTGALVGRWKSAVRELDDDQIRALADRLPEEGKEAALEALRMARHHEPYTGGG